MFVGIGLFYKTISFKNGRTNETIAIKNLRTNLKGF